MIFLNRLSMLPIDTSSMHELAVESVDCYSLNEIRAMRSSDEIMTSISLAVWKSFIHCQDLQPTKYFSI